MIRGRWEEKKNIQENNGVSKFSECMQWKEQQGIASNLVWIDQRRFISKQRKDWKEDYTGRARKLRLRNLDLMYQSLVNHATLVKEMLHKEIICSEAFYLRTFK